MDNMEKGNVAKVVWGQDLFPGSIFHPLAKCRDSSEVRGDRTALQEGSTDPGLLLGKFPEGIPQDELAGKRDRAEHMWGCVFSLLSPFSWKDFLLNVLCSLLWLSLVSCRPLPEETGMESLGSPTEDETTSCKYQPAFPRAQRKPRPRGWQLAGGGKALDSPQKKFSCGRGNQQGLGFVHLSREAGGGNWDLRSVGTSIPVPPSPDPAP